MTRISAAQPHRRRSSLDRGRHPLKAAEIDPRNIANDIIEANSDKGISTLRFWNGDHLKWHSNRYAERQKDETEAMVVQYMSDRCAHVKGSPVRDVLMHLRAIGHISSDTAFPEWLGPSPNGWAPQDCLATPSAIVHLPALAERQEQFSIPATPNFFTFNAIEYEISVGAPTPNRWLQFLYELWPNDPQSIEALQEMLGYLLTASTCQQKIFALIGPNRSGKGTIGEVIRMLVGGRNVASPMFESLSTRFGLEPLVGKSVAVIGDARWGQADSSILVERLLAISGGAKVTVDRKNKKALECLLPTRFVILSNEIPNLPDASGAIVSRLILLRFTESFFGREDLQLIDTLKCELPGIFLWAVDGLRRLLEQGRFTQPESGQELLDSMTSLVSPLSEFVESCCTVHPDAICLRSELYSEYKSWCDRQGIVYKAAVARFVRDLIAVSPKVRDSRLGARNEKRERCLRGIKPRSSE